MIPTCCCSSRFSPIQNSYLNFLLVVSLSRSNWGIWTWALTHLNKGAQKLWTGSTTPLEMKQCVQCSSCTRVCLYWNCESQSSVREHRCRVPHVFSVTNAASAANFASHVIECHSLAVPICLCAVLSLVNPVLEGGPDVPGFEKRIWVAFQLSCTCIWTCLCALPAGCGSPSMRPLFGAEHSSTCVACKIYERLRHSL